MTIATLLGAAVAAQFTPHQVTRSYVQHLEASIDRILPLLTPVGEKAWARGWDPIVLHEAPPPGTGTVFVVQAHGKRATLWQLVDFDAVRGYVRYMHFTPDSDFTELDITLRAAGPDRTEATVRYTWTGLTPEGNALADAMTGEHYLAFMREWEEELNHYLRTGARLGQHQR